MWRALLLVGLFVCSEAHAITLAAGNAEITVRQFVELTGKSILYESGRLTPYYTHAVHSDDIKEALHQLLDGTGLTWSDLNERVISVDPDTSPIEAVFLADSAPRVIPRPVVAKPVLARPTSRSAGECSCAQILTREGWIDGPYCRYEDGRKQYVPERCPLPN